MFRKLSIFKKPIVNNTTYCSHYFFNSQRKNSSLSNDHQVMLITKQLIKKDVAQHVIEKFNKYMEAKEDFSKSERALLFKVREQVNFREEYSPDVKEFFAHLGILGVHRGTDEAKIITAMIVGYDRNKTGICTDIIMPTPAQRP